MECYIFRSDETVRRFMDAMMERARLMKIDIIVRGSQTDQRWVRKVSPRVANRVTFPSFSASTEQTTPPLTDEKRSKIGTHYATSAFLS